MADMDQNQKKTGNPEEIIEETGIKAAAETEETAEAAAPAEEAVTLEEEAAAQEPQWTPPETEPEAPSGEVPSGEVPLGKKPPEKTFRTGKLKRQGMNAALTAVFLAIIVVLNIVASALTERFPSLDVDLTAQGLHSLSEQALRVAKGVEEDTMIYLIGTEEKYREDQINASYGMKYSQVASLAEKLQEANPKIHVKFVDPDTNPDFLDDYASESLSTGMVLVKTEKRYKILTFQDLFGTTQDTSYMGYGGYVKFDISTVDSALAAALETVNLNKIPVMTIATGHGELLSSSYLGAFQQLAEEQNFEVRSVDFLTTDIPEDTQVLVIPAPTTDYTEAEIEKLRAYLDDELREDPVTLLVTCHSTQGNLPKLMEFLEEWGVRVGSGVVAESSMSRIAVGDASYILADRAGSTLSENSYERLVAPSSSPLSLAFEENGNISASAIWTTAASAYVVTENTTQEDMESPETSQQIVAAMATKPVTVGGGVSNRNVVVFGSSVAFTDTFLGTSAFGNRAYLSDLLKYTTATDGSTVTVETRQVQTSTMDVSVTLGMAALLGLGVFTVGLPVLILVVGLVIFLKRRHL